MTRQDESMPGGDDELARLMGEYVDRLLAGETLDSEELRARHPEHAGPLLEFLETFQEIDGPGPGGPRLVRLGDHEIVRQIGRGGMGVVYEAIEGKLRRQVAIKVLPAQLLDDARAIARFIQEARIAARLQHPNIVAVHGMSVDGGTPFYSMELVSGRTLGELLRQVREAGVEGKPATRRAALEAMLPWLEGRGEAGAWPTAAPRDDESLEARYTKAVALAFAGAADGLQHAHTRGVIHRDIKPSNLILDEEGRLRILDFGLARREGDASITLTKELVGTPLYMSPEQAAGQRRAVDQRADIYGLGACLYEMLALAPPIQGQSHGDLLERIGRDEPRPLRSLCPHLSRDLEVVVLKCLEKKPGDRYLTAEALAQDLRRAARGDAIEARSRSAWENAARRVWRRRRTMARLLGLGLVVLAGWLVVAHRFEADRAAASEAYRRSLFDAMVLLGYAESTEGRPARPQARILELQRGPDRHLTEDGTALVEHSEGPIAVDPAREALALLERSTAALPARPEAWYHQARALLLLGRRDEALAVVQGCERRGVRFYPLRSWAAALLGGRVAEAQGHTPAAGSWEELYALAADARARKAWQDAYDGCSRLLERFLEAGEPYLGALLEARLARGVVLLELGRLDEALEDFSAAQAVEPRAMEPILLLASVYLRKGNGGVAERRLEELWKATARREEVARRASSLFYRADDAARALAWAHRVPDEVTRQQYAAQCLTKLERWDEALAAAESAYTLDRRAAYTVGFVHSRRFDHERAVPFYREAADLGFRRLDSLNELGICLDELRRSEEAAAAFQEMLAIDPKERRALRGLGMALMAQGKHEEAERSLNDALQLEPDDAATLNQLGLFYASRRAGGRRDIDRAIALFGQVIESHPENAAAWSNKGWMHSLRGEYDLAIEHCEHAIALDERAFKTRNILGTAHARKGNLEKAVEVFRDSCRVNPLNAVGHYNEGLALEGLERFDESIAAYRRSHTIDATDVRAPYNLANLLRRLGRAEEARTWYERALEAHPGDLNALNNLGACLFELGDLEGAARRFREVVTANPRDGDAWLNLAALEEELQRPTAALEALREGARHAPDDARLFLKAAQLEEKAGSPREALATLERARAALEDRLRSGPLDAARLRGGLPVLDELSRLLIAAGELDRARDATRRALELRREAAEREGASVETLNDCAWALVSCEPADLRDPVAAVRLAERASELAGHGDPFVLDTLALALHLGGESRRAAEAQAKALELLPRRVPPEELAALRAEFEARLKEYTEAAR